MKRILTVFLALTIVICLTACGGKTDRVASKAVKELEDWWEEIYDESPDLSDRYFEIKNTRVITIKDNSKEEFKDIEYVVEFVLFTNYFGTAPYYSDAGLYNNVIVYKDGSMKVTNNYLKRYREVTFNSDFSDIIESIDDLEDKYNCKKEL